MYSISFFFPPCQTEFSVGDSSPSHSLLWMTLLHSVFISPSGALFTLAVRVCVCARVHVSVFYYILLIFKERGEVMCLSGIWLLWHKDAEIGLICMFTINIYVWLYIPSFAFHTNEKDATEPRLYLFFPILEVSKGLLIDMIIISPSRSIFVLVLIH